MFMVTLNYFTAGENGVLYQVFMNDDEKIFSIA